MDSRSARARREFRYKWRRTRTGEGEAMKRKLILAALAIGACLPAIGCLPLNAYDSDPNGRMRQLINQSEDLRQVQQEKNRFWFTNQPSNLTYARLSGSIGP